jgi:type I restriction enzyme S subunit
MQLDVSPDHLEMVRAILRRHVPDREVWAFGSRAVGVAGKNSDLDLCVIGETPMSYETSYRLRFDFSESDIPYSVDVVDGATASASFREIIRRDKIVVQEVSS